MNDSSQQQVIINPPSTPGAGNFYPNSVNSNTSATNTITTSSSSGAGNISTTTTADMYHLASTSPIIQSHNHHHPHIPPSSSSHNQYMQNQLVSPSPPLQLTNTSTPVSAELSSTSLYSPNIPNNSINNNTQFYTPSPLQNSPYKLPLNNTLLRQSVSMNNNNINNTSSNINNNQTFIDITNQSNSNFLLDEDFDVNFMPSDDILPPLQPSQQLHNDNGSFLNTDQFNDTASGLTSNYQINITTNGSIPYNSRPYNNGVAASNAPIIQENHYYNGANSSNYSNYNNNNMIMMKQQQQQQSISTTTTVTTSSNQSGSLLQHLLLD
jgi:hypothetical protein